ncbi:MAG: hypothetical protein C0616_14480 [Desulfuromonas sp.]|nr:MAG: hypothetical protein C0616_14480 [Desulfuromonas sp.]
MLNSIWTKIKTHCNITIWRTVLILLPVSFLAACAHSSPSLQPHTLPEGEGILQFEIFGFRSDEGTALVSIFAGSDGFPDNTDRAVANLEVPISEGKATLSTEPLPYGRYGISVLHDENNNGIMDRNLLGLPTEGFGFSGKADVTFGPPEFQEVRILLVRSLHPLAIALSYDTFGKRKSQLGQPAR